MTRRSVQAPNHAPTLLVSPWFPPTIGGVAQVTERLRQGLVDQGVPVHVLVADGTHAARSNGVPDHVHPMDLPGSFFSNPGPRTLAGLLARGPSAVSRIRRLVRDHAIRNLILLYPIEFAWAFLPLLRTEHLRMIVSLHGNDVMLHEQYASPLQWLQRRTLRSAHRIITCAGHLNDIAASIAPSCEDRICTVPNCIDTEYFRPGSVVRDPEPFPLEVRSGPTFLHVSNFAPKKRTVEIVQAFHNARLAPGSRLIMVGDGPLLASTIQVSESLGLTDRVLFPGLVADVRPFYQRADIFVMASDAEGAPLAILEAMASGLPWISTPWGAAADLPSGMCGIVFECGDWTALADAMSRLARDPDETRRLGREARRIAEEQYSVRVYVDRHLELLA